LFLKKSTEPIVSKKTHPAKQNKTKETGLQPWISMRRGLVIMAITSLIMAGLTTWQVSYSKGWLESTLWGLLFGALIWAIFFGNLLITRFLRK
jgi:hypothetical protein